MILNIKFNPLTTVLICNIGCCGALCTLFRTGSLFPQVLLALPPKLHSLAPLQKLPSLKEPPHSVGSPRSTAGIQSPGPFASSLTIPAPRLPTSPLTSVQVHLLSLCNGNSFAPVHVPYLRSTPQ